VKTGRGQGVGGPLAIDAAQDDDGQHELGKVLCGDFRRDVGEEVHAVEVVGLGGVGADESRGGRGGGARLTRQSLEALLFVVGYVDEDNGGYVVAGGFEDVRDLGET
jgi:hypothetical protein